MKHVLWSSFQWHVQTHLCRFLLWFLYLFRSTIWSKDIWPIFTRFSFLESFHNPKKCQLTSLRFSFDCIDFSYTLNCIIAAMNKQNIELWQRHTKKPNTLLKPAHFFPYRKSNDQNSKEVFTFFSSNLWHITTKIKAREKKIEQSQMNSDKKSESENELGCESRTEWIFFRFIFCWKKSSVFFSTFFLFVVWFLFWWAFFSRLRLFTECGLKKRAVQWLPILPMERAGIFFFNLSMIQLLVCRVSFESNYWK